MLIVVAPALIAASTQRQRKSNSVRVPSSALHSTSSTWLRARVTCAITISSTSCGSFCSFHFMCTGEVDRKVWMRLRSAGLIASAQRSMSLKPARERPQIDRVLGALGDLVDGLEIAVRGDREAGLDDVDAHGVEQLGDFDLLLVGHGGAGALLAVAQGGVEDDDAVLLGLVVVIGMVLLKGAPAALCLTKCALAGARGLANPLSAQAHAPSRPSGADKQEVENKGESRPGLIGPRSDRADIAANRHVCPRLAPSQGRAEW